ncbi:S-adenosyl-L-methionine-dependent methyltransferase [Thozetella sp. PMI_491]|nr:S-adenosyl-L-methionine-dependent methyltransferase [Thozetella sp. PMI_491]
MSAAPGPDASEGRGNSRPVAQAHDSAESREAALEARTTIAADPALAQGGGDEGYDSDATSRGSTSISSSVRDYAFENNRRYHKFQEGRYHFPNDESEQERENMKHAMVVNLMNGKLHLAPVENPQTVLDVGTGTGIWAIDMGDEYPEADILGVDLSPIQPSWCPPNVRFIVDDVEAEWTHPPNSLDYIHIRHMTSSVRDWPKLMSQAYNALKPGGWIELQELRFVIMSDDGTLRDDSQLVKFIKGVKDGLATFGVDLLGMQKNAENAKAAGFDKVQEEAFKIPIGIWPRNTKMKTIGLYNRSMIYDGLQGISMGPFTRGLKWTPQEVEVFLVGVRKALLDSSQHAYLPFHVVIGQKPTEG